MSVSFSIKSAWLTLIINGEPSGWYQILVGSWGLTTYRGQGIRVWAYTFGKSWVSNV